MISNDIVGGCSTVHPTMKSFSIKGNASIL
jgi:hypothetical protein